MHTDRQRKPLLDGRGVMLFEDFCRHTGLDHHSVEHLMRTELAAVALWRDQEHASPFGLFDDSLPTGSALMAMGYSVNADYDPVSLRSYTISADDGDEDDR